ncbi:MAG: PH domain-containing protein [Patescibacteria group bacterium]
MHYPFLINCHGKPEQPILTLRAHPVVFITSGAMFVILLIVPFAAIALLPELMASLLSSMIGGTAAVLLVSLYMLVVLLLGFNHFFNWFFDIWVVTNERIIDVDQEGVFSKKIGELELHKVQDVLAESHGVLATMFGYGRIKVETAGSQTEFAFDGISHPYAVAKRILELAKDDAPLHNAPASQPTAQTINPSL